MHYNILLSFLIFKLQTTVAQYPSHTDLQKVGEVIFNNEKFNVLKPTVHVITDYFKDFMLRRENDKFPTKRVFIDHNGFRHAWSGFGNKVQSLRKTDLKNVVLNSENFTDNLSTKKAPINDNTTEVAKTTTKIAKTTTEVAKSITKTAETTPEVASTKIPVATTEVVKPKTESTENTTDAYMPTTRVIESTVKNSDNITSKETLKEVHHDDYTTESATQVPNSAETTTFRVLFKASIKSNNNTTVTKNQPAPGYQEILSRNAINVKPLNGEIKERTVAQTTFFCPYLGVVTMSSFID